MLNDHCHRVSTHLQSINIIIMICRVRARTTAGASRGVVREARYITHRHQNYRLPAASDFRMKTSARTTSPASFSRNRQQLYRYYPPFYARNQNAPHRPFDDGTSVGFKTATRSIMNSGCYIENAEKKVNGVFCR